MRGDGTVYKRGNVWWIRYHKDGKPYSESSGSADEKVAQRKLRQKVAQLRTNTFIDPRANRLTFEDLAEILRFNYVKKENRSLRTAEQALKRLGTFFGGDLARSITATRIDRYASDRREAGVSGCTTRYDLAILRRAFRLARRDHKIGVPEIEMPPASPARQGFLEPSDFDRLHAALPDYLRDPVEFLFLSGWRVGEMKSLEWRDVNLSEGTITLRIENSKSKEPRVIMLVGTLLEIITRAHSARRLDCPNVFVVDGKPIGSFRKSWTTATKQAGFAGLLVHDLRRSAVRNMIRAGVPRSIAMTISGHETESVFERYNVRSDRDSTEAAARIDAYVAERRREPAKVIAMKHATGTEG